MAYSPSYGAYEFGQYLKLDTSQPFGGPATILATVNLHDIFSKRDDITNPTIFSAHGYTNDGNPVVFQLELVVEQDNPPTVSIYTPPEGGGYVFSGLQNGNFDSGITEDIYVTNDEGDENNDFSGIVFNQVIPSGVVLSISSTIPTPVAYHDWGDTTAAAQQDGTGGGSCMLVHKSILDTYLSLIHI